MGKGLFKQEVEQRLLKNWEGYCMNITVAQIQRIAEETKGFPPTVDINVDDFVEQGNYIGEKIVTLPGRILNVTKTGKKVQS